MAGIEWRQNAYKDERCFLIGTGSSLLFEDDLPRVVSEFSMTCNGLFLWDKMPFVPQVWGCIDHPAFPMWHKQIEALDTYRVAGLRASWPTETPLWKRVLQRRDMPLAEGHFGGLEEEFAWCAGRANVMWTLMAQMAFWLGFRWVYLLGVDGWQDGAPLLHVYELQDFLRGKLQRTPSSINERTQLSTRCAIPIARSIYEQHGRHLVNLNPESFTKGLESSTLKEVLG